MKTFVNRAAQGEIQITRIGGLDARMPQGTKLPLENGKLIIGHSETGHHHCLERPADVYVATDAPAGMRVLYALLTEPNALVHERSFDTHEPIAFEPGMYEFRITREFDPYEKVARRQAD